MIDTGVFYKYIPEINKHVDLFKLKYNANNEQLFDVEVLPDNTIYDSTALFNLISDFDMYDVATKKHIKYNEKLNVDMLISTFNRHYSNREFGIKIEKVTDNESN
jgi:hypothetical protein